ncbi:hypothetical protein [Prevotella sp. P4-119]|uniref:hypothetical protein n=1 Tax=Prevotella sp. P4-119 TaxID=2024218 RepID=UPI000B973D63|nr:hypothetical protein [Prevotella sp. P4-119]OYP46523.1 hypothetical protein CIK89_00765 [Prevotella sp. P4-119]
MTTIECTDEKLALNLNPYQIFVFVNEKTKPYLDQIKRDHIGRYNIELIPFDALKDSQAVVGEDVDPLLYYNITHSDLFARVMPLKEGDYRYTSEILFQGKDYSGDLFFNVVNNFARSLNNKKSKSFVNTLRRYFQYGNEEFYDFLMEVYDGDLSKILEMSKYYSHIVSSAVQTSAENFLADFMRQLSKDKKEELISIIKDTLGFACEKDSKLLLCNYLQYKYTPGIGGFSNLSKVAEVKSELLKPDFSLVIEYNRKDRLMDKDGDYSIILKKDDGNRIELEFGHRGDKMLYLLTLLCQKTRGGLPTAYFKNEQAKQVIKAVYDRMYRSGGDEWVNKCSNNTHTISTYRSHAKEVIENDERLEPYMAYWCNFENQTIFIGKMGNKPLEIRKIRLPEERIKIYDENEEAGSFSDILEKLPHLRCLYSLNKVNFPELFEIHKNLVCGVDQREDDAINAIRE